MSNSHQREFSGKTLEEAVAEAAGKLNLAPEALRYEVLKQPGAFASLLGKRVRIMVETDGSSPQSFDDDNGFEPAAALARIATAIMPEAEIKTQETEDELILEIVGDGSGLFIGRKGKTLEALQFLLLRMAQKQGWQGKRLIVESEQYRERRHARLRDRALSLADKALAERRIQTTEMLSAGERRIIHSTLRDRQGLTSRSLGNGELKRVQIIPEGAEQRRPPRDGGNRGRGGNQSRGDNRAPRRDSSRAPRFED